MAMMASAFDEKAFLLGLFTEADNELYTEISPSISKE
jgi:hypothetical protein